MEANYEEDSELVKTLKLILSKMNVEDKLVDMHQQQYTQK